MQNEIENPTASAGWGGARKGAGRKPKPKGKTYTFRSNPETEQILESVSESKSDYINRALSFYVQAHPLM